MPDKFLLALMTKGTAIGALAGFMRILLAIRMGTFRWGHALTDVVGAVVMGHIVYDWASLSGIAEWQVILITLFSSVNAFLVIAFITDVRLMMYVFSMLIKREK